MFKEKVYQKISNNIFLAYTIVFIVFMLIGLLPIEIKNQSIFFSGMFTSRDGQMDGFTQHSLFMYDFVRSFKGTIIAGDSFQLFRFNISMGSDIILHYTYYSLFDPLTIIAYIIPLQYLEYSYYLLIMLRLYLSGIFVILLAQRFNIKKVNALLATSIFYVFNAAVLFAAFRHPMFINGPMYIPLIILGAEKILNKERPYLLIITSFLALISQFYFYIYIAFGFELFVILRLVVGLKKEDRKEAFKKFINVNLFFALGALLGGFILTTQLMGALSSSRISSKGFILNNGFDLAVTLATFMLPAAGDHFTANIGNIFVFIMALIYIMTKKKTWLSYYFVILSGLLFFASFSYLINLTVYVNNRWSFLICLPAAIIVGRYLEAEIIPEKTVTNKVAKIILIMVIGIGFGLLSHFGTLFLNSLIIDIIYVIILMGLTAYLIYRVINKKLNIDKFHSRMNPRFLTKAVLGYSLFSILIMSCIYLFMLTPNHMYRDYLGDEDLYKVFNEDTGFFRVEQKSYSANVISHSNDGIYYKYASTGSYNSMNNGYVNQYLNFFNIVNINSNVGYNGFDFRTQSLIFNNVKYVIIKESEAILPPYGYTFHSSVSVPKYDEDKDIYNWGGNISRQDKEIIYERANIYINNNFLNVGTMYYDYVLARDLKEINAISRENILLDAVILEKDISSLNKYNDYVNANVNEINDLTLKDINYKDGIYNAPLTGGTISFTINNISNSEVFLELDNILPVDKYAQFKTVYRTSDIEEVQTYYPYGSNFYDDISHRLINLGYYESEDSLEVEIELSWGKYRLDGINYYINDLSAIPEKVNKLNEHYLENFTENNNGFKGHINNPQEGMMVFSIPYHKGFKAFVGKEEVEIHLVNSGYMGIVVPAGEHEISFTYITPGLEIGIVISLMSLGVLIVIILIDIYLVIKKRRYLLRNSQEMI